MNQKIDKDEYYRIVKRWGGKQTFEDMHRDYDTNDGDAYFCVWNNIEITAKKLGSYFDF